MNDTSMTHDLTPPTDEEDAEMTAINLSWTKTTNPDFSGFAFYVEAGSLFDAGDFADAYGLNRGNINHEHVHSVQDAAAQLGAGEWLRIEFERAE